MGVRQKKLERYRKEFQEKYHPDTAMGNEELISLQRSIENIEKELEGHTECSECEGWGVVECDSCGSEKTCEDCEDGLVKK